MSTTLHRRAPPSTTLLVALALACGPAREALLRVTPTVPDPVGCVAGAQRCDGAVPVVCSSTGRWWPALAPRPDGTQRVCADGCAVDDAGVAHCQGPDGGAP